MGARSRKRGRSGAAAARQRPASQPEPVPEPVAGEPSGDGGDALRRGYARGRARDERIRAELEPLAPGERPKVVTVAAIIAFAFALANVGATLSGNDLSSGTGDPSVATAVTTALLVLTGAGMLARQYWAVLGFQAILAIQIIVFSLYLVLGVQRWWQAIVPLIAIGLLGWLFWKLVRAMARLQMPQRRPAEPTR